MFALALNTMEFGVLNSRCLRGEEGIRKKLEFVLKPRVRAGNIVKGSSAIRN